MRSFCVGVLVLAFSLGLTVGTARGQYVETYWQGAPGAPSPWTTASNWSNGLPGHFNGSMSEAYIQNGGTATISGLGTTVSGNVLYLGVYFSGSCLGGNVIQSSGTVNLTEIIFNPSVNAQGNPSTAAYTMSGGSLFVGSLYMQGGFFGGAGNGIFQQTSGTVSAGAIDMIVFGGSATYSLSNGLILTHALTIGGNGSNVFLQTGGSVVGSAWGAGLADAYVTVGQEWYDAPGRYNLYGPGQLATSVLFVTPSSYFDQTAGTVTVNSLFMSGNYHFTGGSLAVSRALTLAGTLDFGGTAESVTVGDAMVDLSQATIINGSQASFSSGPHSLVLVNPSFNGPAVFGGGWNPGNLVLVKNPGGPLVLGPGQGFQGWGNITNHLTCSGTIDAGVLADGSSRGLNLTNGVNVNSGGWINLRSGDSMFNSTTGSNETGGTLNVHDTTSSLATGGTLIAGNEDIGTSGGAGTFTQSGGTNMPGQLLLGYADGTAAAGAGAYYLSGNGIVTAGSINLGLSSPGLFVQSSGTCTVTPGSLVIGSANYQSTYQLSGGTLNANGTYGTKVSKVGSFNHTGGIHNATTLGVGTTSSSGGQAYYTMSAGATLNVTGYEDIGGWGNATFTQNGGTHTMTGTNGNLNLGGYGAVGANILSLYQLNAGILNVGSLLSVGGEGPSTFTQTGGTSIVTGLLRVGGWSTDNATYYAGVPAAYNLGGGVLSAGTETIGHTGSGTLTHTAGSNTVSGALALGDTAFGNGTYNLSGAASQLTAASLVVSNTGTGAFVQNSGTVTVSGDVVLGQMGQSGSGSFAMGGGTLSAVNLIVGRDSGATHGTGLFKTTSSAPVITLTGSLYLGQNGSLNLAPGTTIHMAGSAFANMSQTPSCAASMSNLTLIFEGGTGVVDTFEVASKDLGTGSGSAVNNFVLGTLQIGGIRPGQVQLVNQVVNETGTGVTEILYVKNLVIGNGSYLDLNHQKVYYSTLTNSGTVNLNGGTPASAQQ